MKQEFSKEFGGKVEKSYSGYAEAGLSLMEQMRELEKELLVVQKKIDRIFNEEKLEPMSDEEVFSEISKINARIDELSGQDLDETGAQEFISMYNKVAPLLEPAPLLKKRRSLNEYINVYSELAKKYVAQEAVANYFLKNIDTFKHGNA